MNSLVGHRCIKPRHFREVVSNGSDLEVNQPLKKCTV